MEIMNNILTICIATRNRRNFLEQCLKSIITQYLFSTIEVIIVDGDSSDGTSDLCLKYISKYPNIKYINKLNGGIDADYSFGIINSSSKYCWLLSDDDLLTHNSIFNLLHKIQKDYSFIVLNSNHYSVNMDFIVKENRLNIYNDKTYSINHDDLIFRELTGPICLISSLVVSREMWIERNNHKYLGTYFNHIGVIFQAPFKSDVLLLSDTYFNVRQGNLSWTSKAFYIWFIYFPKLIWKLPFSKCEKLGVTSKRPWLSYKKLLVFRAFGYYDLEIYTCFILRYKGNISYLYLIYCKLLSLINVKYIANILYYYMLFTNSKSKTTMYDLKEFINNNYKNEKNSN